MRFDGTAQRVAHSITQEMCYERSGMKNEPIVPENAPWSDALVLICSKCGRKLESDVGEDLSEKIKSDLKSRIKEEDLKDRIRVSTSSCMDICPKDRIAITVAKRAGQPAIESFSVSPDASPSEIWEKIRKTVSNP